MILVPLIITWLLGFLTIRLITHRQLPLAFQVTLGLSLGLGLAGSLNFLILFFLNHASRFTTIAASSMLLAGLYALTFGVRRNAPRARHLDFHANQIQAKPNALPLQDNTSPHAALILICLSILFVLLILQGTNFPLGGWDAWSCWNLKAKFIYLGEDHWRDMFRPELWRSNTHYPLLLPSLVAFGWQWMGSDSQSWPMALAILTSLNTAAIVLLCLIQRGVYPLLAAGLTTLMIATPLCLTLCISQYSDILVGLFTVNAFACWFLSHRSPPTTKTPSSANLPAGTQDPTFAEQNRSSSKPVPSIKDRAFSHHLILLSALFIGFLSFSKTEGLVAAGLLTLIFLISDGRHRHWRWLLTLAAASACTVLFQLFMAPGNEAFINGLISPTKPCDINRLQVILMYPWIELVSPKWQGLWILLGIGLLLNLKNAVNAHMRWMGIFLVGYLSIVMAYYAINTFFEITWWLTTTLHRVLFALLPTVVLWTGLSFAKKSN